MSDRPCINCGEEGPHFVPPSFGEPGFFTCWKTPTADVRLKWAQDALDSGGCADTAPTYPKIGGDSFAVLASFSELLQRLKTAGVDRPQDVPTSLSDEQSDGSRGRSPRGGRGKWGWRQ